MYVRQEPERLENDDATLWNSSKKHLSQDSSLRPLIMTFSSMHDINWLNHRNQSTIHTGVPELRGT